MDPPYSDNDSVNNNDKIPQSNVSESLRIPNLHPSHRNQTDYGAVSSDGDPHSVSLSFYEQVGSFVDSCSRASLVYMAENVTISPSERPMDEEDNMSIQTTSTGSILWPRNSEGTLHEQQPLFSETPLDKTLTMHSVTTVADTYSNNPTQKSTFTQSILNSINILAGVGILALPLGFKYAGWILSVVIFAFCIGLTNYTAKIVAKCLDIIPDSHTYGDMGAAAFGIQGRISVSILFLTELVTCSVALVVLLCDGLQSLFPGSDWLLVRVASFLILTPMLFFPVRHLSYTSVLGIFSALSIIIVILIDGLSKPTAPGSLIEGAHTDMWPSHWTAVPLSFGLIMAGFAGHAVFPTIYRDMERPEAYRSMVNRTYLATGAIYILVAACGYRMFGTGTLQEITQNIVAIPEYNRVINRAAVWLIALNPIAKYGLTLNPVNLSWQILILKKPPTDMWYLEERFGTRVFLIAGKIFVSLLIIILACVISEFDKVMALLGSLFSFTISGIFPIACYLKLYNDSLSKKEKLINYVLLAVTTVMAISGTLLSFFYHTLQTNYG